LGIGRADSGFQVRGAAATLVEIGIWNVVDGFRVVGPPALRRGRA